MEICIFYLRGLGVGVSFVVFFFGGNEGKGDNVDSRRQNLTSVDL